MHERSASIVVGCPKGDGFEERTAGVEELEPQTGEAFPLSPTVGNILRNTATS